ncbi:SH3 domain-containing protein [Sulfuricurvum sp.]|uniref:SH3 domain-containing protein n=1 Tax=Sulfuricurvum sp. TaxID=2025608 RepID=UPI002D233EAE|nr:SH3 domain-containing protein [Sulfuricurvum sp.]HZF71067.1 SH3 domain-containing protein [Sulfuricurvum sp.]
MKHTIGIFGALIILGGCAPHTPPALPIQTKPSALINQDTNQSTLKSDPFCCALPQELDIKLPEYGPKINDLERFAQAMEPYVEQNGVDRDHLYEVQTTFNTRYYSPWNYSSPPEKAQEAAWPIRAFRGGYGSNLRPVLPAWFEEIGDQCNFESYGTMNQKAITLKWMDIRALPTDKPLYKDPSLPGEGYPFDLLQNSSVNYNEPIFISHTTKDGAWSYIFTNNASGWVKSDGISIISDQIATDVQKSDKVFIIEDNIPLQDSENRFVAYSRIGMVLPLDHENGENYYVKAYDINNSFRILTLPKHAAHVGVSKINKTDLITIGTQLLKNTYGWGGMYGERDCSSMIRDMYTPFGIWLPRNSSAQGRKGEVISFAGISNDEKLSLIKSKGVPFETIIYLKGHVLLYIGAYQDNVLVMHNIWGVRTIDKSGNKGRFIIGKAIISTLELGSELDEFDPEKMLLNRAESMNIFTQLPLTLTRGNKPTSKKKAL